MIQCLAGTACQPGQRFEHHDILGGLHAGNAFVEDGPQLVRHIEPRPRIGHGVLIGPVSGRFLHQMKLLDVP